MFEGLPTDCTSPARLSKLVSPNSDPTKALVFWLRTKGSSSSYFFDYLPPVNVSPSPSFKFRELPDLSYCSFYACVLEMTLNLH